MPEHFIKQKTGKSPEQLLGTVTFSGSHDKTCEMVESGAVQAGAVSYKVYDRRVEEVRACFGAFRASPVFLIGGISNPGEDADDGNDDH